MFSTTTSIFKAAQKYLQQKVADHSIEITFINIFVTLKEK